MKNTKEPENSAYKITLILLLGLAAFTTAMKDLNRLRETVSSVQQFTSQWRGPELATLSDKTISTPRLISESCTSGRSELISSSDEAADSIAAATHIEIETIDYKAIAEPEIGGKVELTSSKKMNRNVSQLARARYASARALKEEIAAQRRDAGWPAHFEFRTNNRIVTLDLPMTMNTDIKADDVDTELSPDFALSLLGRTNRKKTDNSRREFIIKRLERNFGSRRAS